MPCKRLRCWTEQLSPYLKPVLVVSVRGTKWGILSINRFLITWLVTVSEMVLRWLVTVSWEGTEVACHGVVGGYWGGLSRCRGRVLRWLVMVSWEGTEVVSHCFPQVPDWGSVNPNHLFTLHPSRIRLLLTRRETWIFDNREVILTLIISWLRPPLILLRGLKPCL